MKDKWEVLVIYGGKEKTDCSGKILADGLSGLYSLRGFA
jgi:hypothetical protein